MEIHYNVIIYFCFFLSWVLFFFSNRILYILNEYFDFTLPLSVFKSDFFWFFIWGAINSFFLLLIMYLDITFFLKRINNHFKYAIARKMIPNLTEFKSKDLFQEITENANQMFALFKSFDQMKSSRISMEITSVKSLINVISEGVIFVNQDKVVTHINHQAEELLRLMPGEVIGETILRFIDNDELTSHLDTALTNDQKITGFQLVLRQADFVNLTILPIKNKFNEIVRAIIILKKV